MSLLIIPEKVQSQQVLWHRWERWSEYGGWIQHSIGRGTPQVYYIHCHLLSWLGHVITCQKNSMTIWSWRTGRVSEERQEVQGKISPEVPLSRSANKVGGCCKSDASTPNLSCKICDFDKSDLHCLHYLCDSSNPITRTSDKQSWLRIWSMLEPSKIISIYSCLLKLAFHHNVWTWLAQLNGWRKLIAPWEFWIF